ncbi:MAG: class I SAM-dependent methyltransferase [Anaerolineae bacterium]|nr:class I SAM-dependent methyltransferase [Anaerolineae bacterium]
MRCDLIDINPFLVWFARVKTASYSRADLETALAAARGIAHPDARIMSHGSAPHWVPPIRNIERWWHPKRLAYLSRLRTAILEAAPVNSPAWNLLLVAFCRMVIELSNAAFNHQSMSFKANDGQLSLFGDGDEALWSERFLRLVRDMAEEASQPLAGAVTVIQGDARHVPPPAHGTYDAVITSPPYPNRMSYIRELRPYMYWLGFLRETHEAGTLDWSAIGGTWGAATSKLLRWQPLGHPIPYSQFDALLSGIAAHSDILASYIHRYFEDIRTHLQSLFSVLRSGAKVFYVVGNSKFYDTLVPVEDIYVHLLDDAGFVNCRAEMLRKRNSKKELAEFVVSAIKR